ncbi:hypothetical protein PR202_gb29619 [Eleusine coracana subsp. coracana]|uniref:ABC transporter domain-containing protein n=1 Tax=Eleusine coracana subsp. coracana TaxID=191504 RepID=A0AAV5G233_ELECO|nr:hypothetical protein PR202_gb29619 [Eleusine coracana subsp. coracana]
MEVEQYRSSSSSASSPARRYYLPKPGRPISFEDSPDWDDDPIHHLHLHLPEPEAAASSSINSSAIPSPAPSLPQQPCRERKVAGAALVWKELTVSVRGRRSTDRLVKSSNGYALPATLTVIMGPARSGKSTLLRAIAGRLTAAERVYGEVFVNGAKSRLPYGSYGYVDRDDVLIESLTVREMLYFSALLQLPGFLSSKKSIVEDAIAAMSLGDHADKLIGGHCFTKALPTGERRRVSIARELVMRPHVLFIDEPLYNLDSVSALLLMVTLKKLASTGCTVIFTMYQSSTEVFGLFDRICLLSNGNTLFFGETLACLQDDQGDFSSVSMDTAVAIRTLEATYKQSADSVAVESMIAKLTEKVRVSAIFAFVSFVIFLSVSGVPAHIDEVKIYSHEERNRHSGTMVFLLAHFLSSIPFLFLVSISSSLVFYFLIGLRNEFSFLMYFGLLENEYVGTSFAVGQIRTIPGVQAVRGSYDISSSSNAKWVNLLVLLLMAIGYRILLYVLLRFNVRKHVRLGNWRSCWSSVHTASAK